MACSLRQMQQRHTPRRLLAAAPCSRINILRPRLLPPPQSEADWDAAQFCDGPETGIVFVFRRTGETAVQRLRLRAIDSDRDYRVTDEATGDGDIVTGHELATEGLRVELAVSSAKLFSYCPV